MIILITILYTLSLLYIFLFSMSQLHLTYIYLNKKKKNQPESTAEKWRSVTVQLPVYNEKYVVARLLEAVSKLDYPKDKLEIQILDDSTDETTDIIRNSMVSFSGPSISLIHRNNRDGYKAGALLNGFRSARGELIAIFDADFIPQPDFLKKTVPYFGDPSTGAVQTRWGHINSEYSLLTKLQAFGLDAHFSVEQTARNAVGSFINFNGTCGIWRKQCIEDAGGWSADTLTEDLDLSYRAQLTGWKLKYLEEVVTPGELPVIMQAVKSQQYRWNKGGAETARKIFGRLIHSDIGIGAKIHAFFHLFNSAVFTALLMAALLSVPMLYIKANHPAIAWLFHLGLIFFVGFLSISFFYWTATKQFYKGPGKIFLSRFPAFLIVSMGLSLHNGLAVLEGFFGRRTPFIRTPKFNILSKGDSWKGNSYIKHGISLTTVLEGILCLYFIFGIIAGIELHDSALLIFHIMLALGFGIVFYYSVRPVSNA
jgi:cellulose synthase/poly-beta-1,6-N-acetylglucosamine synthase-like glycosyltransferase